MGSKSLISAARYIDAVYDIQIDESHPNLDRMIQKAMETLDSPEIDNYWYAYQLEIDPSLANKVEEQVQTTETNREPRYYRGVLIEEENPSDEIDSLHEEGESSELKNTEFVENRRSKEAVN